MKKYDLIAVGSGSPTNIVEAVLERDRDARIAIIDKDEPGGICLTRGCIPSKLLLYPAELIRTAERAGLFGIELAITAVDFPAVMERMRGSIARDIDGIRSALSKHPRIDYYHDTAEFTGPYEMRVGGTAIKAPMIFLCTGSRPLVPPVEGLAQAGYLTSDTVLELTRLPASIVILGGGYIAAEYGHFFAAMGARVTILGRSPRFPPSEEPEVAVVAQREMSRFMTILTDHEVVAAAAADGGRKTVTARSRATGKTQEIETDAILVAAGRGANADLIHPERAGIRTTPEGWFEVNEYLETSLPNVWAFGDADGKFPFKHKANYESLVVYYNAILNRRVKVDYHAVPHVVFTYPEMAAVGMGEGEALAKFGQDGILVGIQLFQDTAKGMAMQLKDHFVKVIVRKGTNEILGAHIIGPQASLLIQEIVTLMYTPERTYLPITEGMHVHPALSEVVERAFHMLLPPAHYRHFLHERLGIRLPKPAAKAK